MTLLRLSGRPYARLAHRRRRARSTDDGTSLIVLRQRVATGAFGPDGVTLVLGTLDADVELYTIDMTTLERLACTIAGREPTAEEGARYGLPPGTACHQSLH